MELAVHDDLEPVVLHILAVHFLFVVGGVIFASFVSVVAAAILEGPRLVSEKGGIEVGF